MGYQPIKVTNDSCLPVITPGSGSTASYLTVSHYVSDATVSWSPITIDPPRPFYDWCNCPNCGAPFGTKDVCEYCDTMRK